MKKTTQTTFALILTAIIGVAIFYAYNGSTATLPTAAERKILDVQNERLTKGDAQAPVKIVEYADILCPYCAKANEETIPQIQTSYIDKGQVQYEVRLVAMIAPDSARAAEGAYCAADQNKFWKYLDTAYKDTWEQYYSKNMTPRDVTMFSDVNVHTFASKIGLDMATWQQCMADGKYEATLTQNQQQMSDIGANGTPLFIINGKEYNGAPPFSLFKTVIDAELRQTNKGS